MRGDFYTEKITPLSKITVQGARSPVQNINRLHYHYLVQAHTITPAYLLLCNSSISIVTCFRLRSWYSAGGIFGVGFMHLVYAFSMHSVCKNNFYFTSINDFFVIFFVDATFI
jgi:hypothetical protein